MEVVNINAAAAEVRPREEPLAIAGLALGSFGVLFGLPGLVGLVLSVIALHRIERSRGAAAGRTTAMVGVAISATTAWVWEVIVAASMLHYGAGVALPIVDQLLP
jgi:hypothetical protein